MEYFETGVRGIEADDGRHAHRCRAFAPVCHDGVDAAAPATDLDSTSQPNRIHLTYTNRQAKHAHSHMTPSLPFPAPRPVETPRKKRKKKRKSIQNPCILSTAPQRAPYVPGTFDDATGRRDAGGA